MKFLSILMLLLLSASVVLATGNQPTIVVPNPHDSQFGKTGPTYWEEELPSIFGRFFRTDWVFTKSNSQSGLHSTTSGCISPAFSVEAFSLPGGSLQRSDRILATSDVAATGATTGVINYTTIGVPGCFSGSTVARVFACAADIGGNWHNATGTNYYVNYSDVAPATPARCAALMDVTITSGNIVAVLDLRHKSPFINIDLCDPLEQTTHTVFVHCHKTGGDGTAASPWSGWDTAINWNTGQGAGGGFQNPVKGTHFFFVCGVYVLHTKVRLPNNFAYVIGDPSGGMEGCVQIIHTPTDSVDADGYNTAFEFGSLAATGGNLMGRFENIQIYSEDITHVKRAIHLIDERQFTIRNVQIFGFNPLCTYSAAGHESRVTQIGYCDTVTFNTRGIDIEGREFIRIEDTQVIATRPVYIAGAPVRSTQPPEAIIYNNADLFAFHNVAFWQVPSTIPIAHAAPLYFDPLVFLTNFNIDGHCSLIGGQHFIYMDQSARPVDGTIASWGIVIENCRGEQVDGDTGHGDDYRYVFIGNTDSNAPPYAVVHGLTFRNVDLTEGGIGRGWYLEKVASVLFESCTYNNANYNFWPTHTNIAVHLGPNTYPVTFLNSWIVDSSFIEVTGNQCITFNAGYNGRFGPLGGSPLVVFDVTDSAPGGAGCTQQPILTPAQALADIGGFHPPVLASIKFKPSLIGTNVHPGPDDNAYVVEDHTNVNPLLWTPSGQIGYWTRSGQLVHIFARIALTAKGTWGDVVSMNFYTGAVSNSNYPPPVPAPLEAMRQVLQVNFEHVALPFSCLVQATTGECAVTVDSTSHAGTCVVTDGTCTTPNTYTGMVAVMEPHFAEGVGPSSVYSNVTFLLQGNNQPQQYLTWDMITNTTILTVSGTYVTER